MYLLSIVYSMQVHQYTCAHLVKNSFFDNNRTFISSQLFYAEFVVPYLIQYMYVLPIYMYCTRTQVPNLTLSSWTLARVTLLSREIQRERGRKKQIQANIMAAIMNLCMKTLGMIPIIPENSKHSMRILPFTYLPNTKLFETI